MTIVSQEKRIQALQEVAQEFGIPISILSEVPESEIDPKKMKGVPVPFSEQSPPPVGKLYFVNPTE